ncbi:hypothetical protein NP493_327g01004 [Ridgeia piscesae]|uniref:Uncharacterized protein n=1 Tax=Ridgeia piscesae TaxID=27915 RepID=A0AAD9NU96_RIDPI|nr:hypothetical protein NP493_327g01004 [Ridgeia piscesae]
MLQCLLLPSGPQQPASRPAAGSCPGDCWHSPLLLQPSWRWRQQEPWLLPAASSAGQNLDSTQPHSEGRSRALMLPGQVFSPVEPSQVCHPCSRSSDQQRSI